MSSDRDWLGTWLDELMCNGGVYASECGRPPDCNSCETCADHCHCGRDGSEGLDYGHGEKAETPDPELDQEIDRCDCDQMSCARCAEQFKEDMLALSEDCKKVGNLLSEIAGKGFWPVGWRIGMTKIEDLYDCGVYSYMRPKAHSKSGAFLRGDSPVLEEWAYVLKSCDGSYWELSTAVPGFQTREDAHRAGVNAACAREARKRR